MKNEKLQSILDKLKKCFDEIEKSDNVKIEFGNISHTPSIFTLSIKGIDLSKTDDINRRNLEMSKHLGFTQNIIGFEFRSIKDNSLFKIVEFKPRNRTYPIIAMNMSNNKMFKFAPKYVLTQIGGIKQVNRIANLDNLLK